MADLPITLLPSSSIPSGSYVLPIVNNGITDQVTVTNLGNGIFRLNLPLTSSGLLISGNILPAVSKSFSLGSPDFPFRDIYISSGSLIIASDTIGQPSTTLSNVSGNILISAGGMQLIGSGSFNATTASFQYQTGSLNYVGSEKFTGSFDISGSFTSSLQQNYVWLGNSSNRSTPVPISTLAVSGGFYTTSSFGFYGAFCSTASQTNPVGNISRSMNLETTELSNGVTIASNSRITVANAGTYNLQFSAQLEKTNNGVDIVYIWFKKNGSNVARSNTSLDVTKQAGGSGRLVAAWNYVDDYNAGDYVEIVWQSADTNMQLAFDPAAGNYPSIPSVIATLTQVS
jgi:hypothetical protein